MHPFYFMEINMLTMNPFFYQILALSIVRQSQTLIPLYNTTFVPVLGRQSQRMAQTSSAYNEPTTTVPVAPATVVAE